MRAVVADGAGGPQVLRLVERPDPEPGPGEVALDVVATAVNRADLLQREGYYPPPEGASDVLGLECSGRIADVGPQVEGWQPGHEVCALLAGGGYASRVVVPAGQVMPAPPGLDLGTAAAVPEAACTVWSNLFLVAGLQPGETLLVHGGAGGIGTFAIQLASSLGARVITTCGSAAKQAVCESLGAEVAVDYRAEDFVDVVRQRTDGRGADVVLDNMGASYLGRNLSALATGGRLVVIGLQGGARGELDLSRLLAKRAAVVATALRSRPTAEKATICAAVVEHVWPLLGEGRVRPVVHIRMPLSEVATAHTLMESGEHVGKIVLTVSAAPPPSLAAGDGPLGGTS